MFNEFDNADTIIEIVPSGVNEARRPKSNIGVSGASLMDPRLGVSLQQPNDFINIYRQQGAGADISFGSSLRSALQMGSGYNVEVNDFGDAVVVKVSYNNLRTGKSASQSFVILFRNKFGANYIKCNASRWRTCNDYSQAASFIRGKASGLQSKTSGTA